MNPPDLRLPENLRLRPACPSDAAFLATLYRSTRDDLRLLDAPSDAIEALVDQQYQAQGQGYAERFPDAWHFVAEEAGTPIGRVILDFTADQVRLVDLSLIPAARGRGIGARLLQALQQAATQVCAPLTLSVNPLNQAARRLYLRLGFRVVEATPVLERLTWFPERPTPRR